MNCGDLDYDLVWVSAWLLCSLLAFLVVRVIPRHVHLCYVSVGAHTADAVWALPSNGAVLNANNAQTTSPPTAHYHTRHGGPSWPRL